MGLFDPRDLDLRAIEPARVEASLNFSIPQVDRERERESWTSREHIGNKPKENATSNLNERFHSVRKWFWKFDSVVDARELHSIYLYLRLCAFALHIWWKIKKRNTRSEIFVRAQFSWKGTYRLLYGFLFLIKNLLASDKKYKYNIYEDYQRNSQAVCNSHTRFLANFKVFQNTFRINVKNFYILEIRYYDIETMKLKLKNIPKSTTSRRRWSPLLHDRISYTINRKLGLCPGGDDSHSRSNAKSGSRNEQGLKLIGLISMGIGGKMEG